jgi:hypothetical protein
MPLVSVEQVEPAPPASRTATPTTRPPLQGD